MAYNFMAPVADNAGPISHERQVATIDRWTTYTQDSAKINSAFYFDSDPTQRFHGQGLKEEWFHYFLNKLHLADPLNKDVKIVIRMAVGSAGNIRPLLGFSSQSNLDIAKNYDGNYWQFQTNILKDPDSGTFSGPDLNNDHEISPGTASAYEHGLDNIATDELYKCVSYVSGGQRNYVNFFIYDNDAVRDFYNRVKTGTNGQIRLYLFFGAAAENPRDEGGTGSHPMSFRPILDLKFLSDGSKAERSAGDSSYFWDFSTPCPPNCNKGQ